MPTASSPLTRPALFSEYCTWVAVIMGTGRCPGRACLWAPLWDSPSPLLEETLWRAARFFWRVAISLKAPLSWNSEDVMSPAFFQKLAGF